MSIFRKLAHLEEQLGTERFNALLNSGNTGKTKDFCDQLIRDSLPNEITVGGVTYEILSFLKEDEKIVFLDTVVARAKKMGAHLGANDREHFLKHQDEIPVAFQGLVYFIFTDDRPESRPEARVCVTADDGRWHDCHWASPLDKFGGKYRLLRRKQ